MKKYVLYFLTSLSALWMSDLAFTGVRFLGPVWIRLVVGAIVTFGIFLTESLSEKFGKNNNIVFLLVGILVNFFVVYFATFLDGFGVTGGELSQVGLSLAGDQILMLLLTSLIITIVGLITKWSSTKE